MNGPIEQEALLSLALPRRKRGAAFDIAQIDVVAEACAFHVALGVDREHYFRLGIVPAGYRVQSDLRAPSRPTTSAGPW